MDCNYKLITIMVLMTAFVCAETPVPIEDRIANTQTNAPVNPVGTNLVAKTQIKYSWRICYVSTNLTVVPFFANGETWSLHTISETQDLTEATNEITRLGLTLTAEQQDALDELEPVPKE